ncbi:MAG: hypothetical protein M8467_17550 [Anaerolineae bacterium]|nr:hypothetical protein [Anaerolineae bacterium]
MSRRLLSARASVRTLVWFLVVSLLPGCGGAPAAPVDALPGDGDLPGWTLVGEAQDYNSDNLFDLVNGQAEAYFAYGFERVATQRYEHGEGIELDVQVWQLAGPEDAYGLFTLSRGGTGVAIGDGGDADPGRRIIFWKDRYYVQVFARRQVPGAELEGVARGVSGALPAAPSGETPALVARLPADGLAEGRTIFFHEEISIQDVLWLGGENLLGLGPETDGILGQYQAGDDEALLLLVQYPDARDAAAALAALQATDIVAPVGADVQGDLLVAVFGQVDDGTASDLISQALREQ